MALRLAHNALKAVDQFYTAGPTIEFTAHALSNVVRVLAHSLYRRMYRENGLRMFGGEISTPVR